MDKQNGGRYIKHYGTIEAPQRWEQRISGGSRIVDAEGWCNPTQECIHRPLWMYSCPLCRLPLSVKARSCHAMCVAILVMKWPPGDHRVTPVCHVPSCALWDLLGRSSSLPRPPQAPEAKGEGSEGWYADWIWQSNRRKSLQDQTMGTALPYWFRRRIRTR